MTHLGDGYLRAKSIHPMSPKAEKWEIAGPAGDMRVEQEPNGWLPKMTVTLGFRDRDLQIVFGRVVHQE